MKNVLRKLVALVLLGLAVSAATGVAYTVGYNDGVAVDRHSATLEIRQAELASVERGKAAAIADMISALDNYRTKKTWTVEIEPSLDARLASK